MKYLKKYENFQINEGYFLTILLYAAAAYSLWILFWKYLRYYADKYRDQPEEQPIMKFLNMLLYPLEKFNKAGDKFMIKSTLMQLKYSKNLKVKEDDTLLIITTDSGEEILINKKEMMLIFKNEKTDEPFKISIDQTFLDKLKEIIKKYEMK